MKDSGQSHPFRSLLALALVLGLGYLVLDFSGRLYYGPLCRRYGESQRLTYISHPIGWRSWPAECSFRNANRNTKRVEVSTIPLTSEDWVRRLLSWVALVAGMGTSVWLASLVGGFKPGRRRR